eukprot:2528104-Alexandrium_andersonii.AAC.1
MAWLTGRRSVGCLNTHSRIQRVRSGSHLRACVRSDLQCHSCECKSPHSDAVARAAAPVSRASRSGVQ